MGNTTYYQNYTARVPETPLRYQQGFECISPALAYVRIQNSEIPQLYPVFPWGEYGLGLPNLSRAINTYFYDTETQSFHDNTGKEALFPCLASFTFPLFAFILDCLKGRRQAYTHADSAMGFN